MSIVSWENPNISALHGNIDKKLVNSLQGLLKCEIIGLYFYYVLLPNSIEHVSIVHTCNTYFVC